MNKRATEHKGLHGDSGVCFAPASVYYGHYSMALSLSERKIQIKIKIKQGQGHGRLRERRKEKGEKLNDDGGRGARQNPRF
jgi:hypothetical protein